MVAAQPGAVRPADRAAALAESRNLKMARSAHAYVRGNTRQFYEWLQAQAPDSLPAGPAIWICGASAVVALLQFGTLQMAVAVGSVSIILHVISGYIITPWLTSRTSRLNAVVVFIGVLAWGWLWGVWGLLLGTPILMALKAICDRVDDLKAIGELLGGSDKPGEGGSGTVAA